jgi:hypothetical protein
MPTMTPPVPVAASDLVAGVEHATLFARSRKLHTVELDGYVDERGVRHVLLAVFGHGDAPPMRWRVLDAVVVDEAAQAEPLEQAAHVAAMYVAERIETKEGSR